MGRATTSAATRAYRFAWAIVWYTVIIIAWGAWVRISHSGDGCGDHWPLCNGEAVPLDGPVKTWIEVSHRYSTALYGVLVGAMIGIALKVFGRSHPAFRWSLAVFVFTVLEALIGRQLVTMRLVDQSTDLARLIVMPLHLLNTSLLLLSTVFAAESFRFGFSERRALSPELRRLLSIAIVVLLMLLLTGAIAALGSHLAPSTSLESGLAHDLSSDSHLAVRLRLLHPLGALAFALLVPLFFSRLAARAPSPLARAWFVRLRAATYVAIVVGITTLSFLAPPWLKLTHLFLANVLVILLSLALFHTLQRTEV
jgi:heme A synthase